MVLAGSLASICTALASSATLKMPNVGGMAGPSGAEGTRRLSPFNSAVMTVVVVNSILSYLQSSACCALASMVTVGAYKMSISSTNMSSKCMK
jgi:hypothetical protein